MGCVTELPVKAETELINLWSPLQYHVRICVEDDVGFMTYDNYLFAYLLGTITAVWPHIWCPFLQYIEIIGKKN